MSNKYLQRIEDLGLEKQAFDPLSLLIHGVATHVGQNALTAAAIRSKGFGKNVAEHFHAGLQGRQAPSMVPSNKSLLQRTKDTLNTDVRDLFSKGMNNPYVAGGVNPELNILKDEAYHAGHKFRQELATHGFTPEDMTPEMKDVLSHATKGNFTHLKSKWIDDPLAQRVIGAYEKATGHPITKILKGTDDGIAQAEAAWKKNPLTGNIASQVGDFADVSHLPKGMSEQTTRKSLVGTAALSGLIGAPHGMVDPALAVVNSFKTAIADKRLLKVVPSAQKPIDKFQDFFFHSNLAGAAKKGLEGKQLNQPYSIFKKTFGSNLVTESESLTNDLARAANRGTFKDVVDEGKYLLNRSDELIGGLKNMRDTAVKTYHETKPLWEPIVNNVPQRMNQTQKIVPQTPKKEPNKYLERLALGGAGVAGGLGGIGIAKYTDRNQQPIPT